MWSKSLFGKAPKLDQNKQKCVSLYVPYVIKGHKTFSRDLIFVFGKNISCKLLFLCSRGS